MYFCITLLCVKQHFFNNFLILFIDRFPQQLRQTQTEGANPPLCKANAKGER